MDMLLEAARLDAWHYKFTLAYLALQLVVTALRTPTESLRRARIPRASWDATWFLPVYVWGLESLRHGYWWLFEVPYTGFEKTVYGFVARVELSGGMLFIALGGCFLAEHLARRKGLPCRAAAGAVPLPTVAAILGVGMRLALWLAMLFSMPRGVEHAG